MNVIMKAKNQVTLPKKLTSILGIKEGDVFKVGVSGNKIQLIPLKVSERKFTKKISSKIKALTKK